MKAVVRKKDGRRIGPDEQFERRKRIAHLIDEGCSNQEISKKVGVCLTHVSTIRQKYCKGGIDALKPKKRGRKHGEQRLLSPVQEAKIKTILVKRTPDQLGLDCHLWTRDAIRRAILQECGVGLQLRTVTDYQSRWGFTPNKPIKDTNKKCHQSYRRWLKSGYKDIVDNSKVDNYEIYWINDNQIKPPNKIKGFNQVFVNDSLNMISAISNQGEVRFMLYRNDMTDKILIDFLSNLVEDVSRKAFLIFYNKEIYQSEYVHEWVDDRKDDIELEYLEDCYLGSDS